MRTYVATILPADRTIPPSARELGLTPSQHPAQIIGWVTGKGQRAVQDSLDQLDSGAASAVTIPIVGTTSRAVRVVKREAVNW